MSTASTPVERKQGLAQIRLGSDDIERHVARLFGCLLQPLRGVDRQQAATVDDGNPLADHGDFREDVGAEQHGMVPTECADDFAGLVDLCRIESGGRLVEQQDFGIAQQGLRQAQPLPVALRELVDLLSHHGLEVARRDDPIQFARSRMRGTPRAFATKRR